MSSLLVRLVVEHFLFVPNVAALGHHCLAAVISWKYNFADLRIWAPMKVEAPFECLVRVHWQPSLLVQKGP